MSNKLLSRFASLALAAGLITAAAPARAAPASVTDRISTAVARVMEYPREVRDQEGVVVLGFIAGRSGAAERIELLESSGYPLLDEAALSAVARLHDLPGEAVGRRLITVLQYRTGGPGRDPVAARRLQTAVDQVKSRGPAGLLSAR